MAQRRLGPAHVTSEPMVEALLRQLARMVADELRADVERELRRLSATQLTGDELTCSVTEAAKMLGIDRNTAYAEIHRTGALAGIPVLRIGERYRVSRVAILQRLMGEQAGEVGTGLLSREEK
ncbi:MAG: helix-turn-helix domain-containing protein [Thermomicrobium sp.]|nr:helix-turn-helix domain-containing protein [Thermomicrobium sp.]MDW8060016.1 helix-turn-helix domain-containing protein [Thermomicrobium sp.]